MWNLQQDNTIGVEGTKQLSDVLKTNKALIQLNLQGILDKNKVQRSIHCLTCESKDATLGRREYFFSAKP